MPADTVTRPAQDTTADRAGDRPGWRLLKRTVTVLFFALVAWLIVKQARTVDWPAVLQSLRSTAPSTLLLAAALAAASHALYCTYDLIGRHLTRHSLRTRQVVSVGFVSYAFNLNFGSLVGGVAFRYRLYSRLGLDTATITQVLGMSLLTNWLGYAFVGGCVFTLALLPMPDGWRIGSDGLRVVGVCALLLVAGYLALCMFSKRREWKWRGQSLQLASPRVALLQLLLSSLNWMLIAGVVYWLLRRTIDYPSVLTVVLLAAVAGVITHVPAGLGVLEAVFVALLSHRIGQAPLLAALLTYRAIYYLAPLTAALPLFLVMDARARRLAEGQQQQPSQASPPDGGRNTRSPFPAQAGTEANGAALTAGPHRGP